MTKYETKMAFIRGDRSVFHAWTKLTQLGWAKKNQHWQKRPFPCSEVCCCKPAHRARDSFETRKELAADLEKHGRSAAQRKPLLQTLLVLAPHVASPRPGTLAMAPVGPVASSGIPHRILRDGQATSAVHFASRWESAAAARLGGFSGSSWSGRHGQAIMP